MSVRSNAVSLLAAALLATACSGQGAGTTATSLIDAAPTTVSATTVSTTVAGETNDDATDTTTADDGGASQPRGTAGDAGTGGVGGEGTETYTDYVEVADDGNSIVMSVPAEWDDTVAEPWDLNGELVGPSLGAAPDYAAFHDGWDTPGVFIAASSELDATAAELLDFNDFSSVCTYTDRLEYDDGFYAGFMDVWEECGGESSFVVVAAQPPEGEFLTLVQLVIVSDADWDAADEIIRSFRVSDPQAP